MEDEICKAFFMGFSTILFVAAVTLLIVYHNKLDDIYNTLYYQTMNEAVLIKEEDTD